MIHNTITQSHEKTREEGLLGFPSYYEPRKFFKLLYKYINPYTKPPVKETIQFKFDSGSKETSMNNWLNAMDEAVNKVVGAYNSAEGKSAAP